MNINSPVSFKSIVPVKYFAKNPKNGQYVPVLKDENIRKCQGYIVRNLNKSESENKNENFVSLYSFTDREYSKIPYVRSVYSYKYKNGQKNKTPDVYLLTGRDAIEADKMARPIGVAKSDSKEKYNTTDTRTVKETANTYFYNLDNYIRTQANPLKNERKEALELHVYFEPQYTKDNKLKKFEYSFSAFVPYMPQN